MYYLPYMDYGLNLPSYLNFFRDNYLKQLKRRHSWFEYKMWRSKYKEFKLMRIDVRYKKVHETIFL